MNLLTVLWCFLSIIPSHGWEDEVKSVVTPSDLEILFLIESNNNLSAIGDGIRAIGVLQIHRLCVEDVNRYYKLDYSHVDMYGRLDSIDVFYKYLAIGAKLYFKKYGKFPTKKDYLRMWNGGIYKGYQKKSTIAYYQKFKKEESKQIVLGSL